MLTSLRSRLILCGIRLGIEDGKLSILSHEELDPVPRPTKHPVLILWAPLVCEIEAFALGGECCAPGLPRTVDMSTGAMGGHLEGTSCSGFLLFSQHAVLMLWPCREWEGSLIFYYKMGAALARELAGNCQAMKTGVQDFLRVW